MLTLIRFSSSNDDTLGILYAWNKFECFTLEDEYRTEKKYGETRIPAGKYPVKFRTVGSMNDKYKRKFGDKHHGMLELKGVPQFDAILIHIGNREDDTAGCILVGDSAGSNVRENGYVGQSTQAYVRLYDKVSERLLRGEYVEITIQDYA